MKGNGENKAIFCFKVNFILRNMSWFEKPIKVC